MGLGHSTSVTSVPTDVMAKYSKVDAILLVDDATQPLMDNSKMALKDVIYSGYADKLLMVLENKKRSEKDNRAGQDPGSDWKMNLRGEQSIKSIPAVQSPFFGERFLVCVNLKYFL